MPEITIKLKPYLQDYLRCVMNEPINGSLKTLPGQMIRPFLEYRPKCQAYTPQNSPEYITIELPTYDDLDVRNNTVYISDENQLNLQRILDAHFQSLFMMYYENMIRHHDRVKKKNIILQFCSDYNLHFNNDFYEMMKKRIQRFEKEKIKKPEKFTKKRSFTCPLIFL